MPDSAQSATHNHLLAGLPQPLRGRLIGRFEPIELRSEEVLCKPGQRMRYVYFPTRSFISLILSDTSDSDKDTGPQITENQLVSVTSAPPQSEWRKVEKKKGRKT